MSAVHHRRHQHTLSEFTPSICLYTWVYWCICFLVFACVFTPPADILFIFFNVSSRFISSLLTHLLPLSSRSLNSIRTSSLTARQRRSPPHPGLCQPARTQNISCSLTMRWGPTGWAAGMQMVREAAGQWGRTAPGWPDGRPPDWGWTTTEGPWSPWPRGTGTLCLTGWVRRTLYVCESD